jgi:hypothetical protein
MALQTKSIALLVAIVALSAGLIGYAAATEFPSLLHIFAASTTTNDSQTTNLSPPQGQGPPFMNGGGQHHRSPLWGGGGQQATSIPAGTTITITSTQGQFIVFGSPGDNGTASGTLTFTVNSQLASGYVLTLTSGTITVNGSSYTVSSGTAQMNPFANGITGQGTASSSSSFTIRALATGSFTGTTSARVMLDFKTSSSEYGVMLTGTIQG